MTATPLPLNTPHHGHVHHELSFVKKYLFSTDHKVIGLQFLFVGLFFLAIGGLLAMAVRWQLGWPNAGVAGYAPLPLGSLIGVNGAMDPNFYNAAFTMHASIMIFLVVIPLLVGTFGNYLIPLKIGAPDMAFPFLNGAAFWLSVPAGLLLVASFLMEGGAPGAGWTSYPTLSTLWHDGTAPINDAKALLYVAPVYSQSWGLENLSAIFSNPLAAGKDFMLWTTDWLRLRGTKPTGETTRSTWHSLSLIAVYVGLLLNFLYLCAYQVRLSFRPLNWLISLVLSGVAAFFSLKLFQFLCFDGQATWFFAIFLIGFSSIMGAVNYLTTIVKMRAPGMTLFRMPLSVWSLFITSFIVLLATPVLAASLFMNLLDHHRFTTFFLPFNWTVSQQVQTDVAGGGYPILHQHLFWFYSHPAVYIMILPAMGMVSDVIAVFARKPIFGYKPMIYAMSAIAFLGFIVWAHHMFQSGMNASLATGFAVSTMLIAVPSAIKTFNWLGTLWRGNIRFTTPMLHAVTFVAMFVIGGLSGIFMASTAVDIVIHDTYFIVAHIHYVLFGGSLFGIFAAITFWYPKMFGRMMNETLGKLHWFISFVAFNCTFFPMHILGMRGMARRVYDYTNYTSFADLVPMNQFISYAAFVMGAAQVIFALNFVGSWIFGRKAGRNPWESTTLEWETASPPPHGNFEKTPIVYHGPYEYSSPLVEEDWLAQTRKLPPVGAPTPEPKPVQQPALV